MLDREKVIRNLQSVANVCALNGDIQSMRTIDDALALLKEQEARVLTKEEADRYVGDEPKFEFSDTAPLYVEHRKPDEFCLKWIRYESAYAWMHNFGMRENYGVKFRFWTSCPTEEQRQNTPWEPPKEDDDG